MGFGLRVIRTVALTATCFLAPPACFAESATGMIVQEDPANPGGVIISYPDGDDITVDGGIPVPTSPSRQETSAAGDICADVRKGQPATLKGELTHRIFPGPPNYEDVQQGDMPESAYVLRLDEPMCITGDEFSNRERLFSTVQLVPGDGMANQMAAFTGRQVYVRVSDRFGAHTGHHHAPLVAFIDQIQAETDIITEYGTAATVVRAFYYALEAGDGKEAARFVVPEKRRAGPLSAESLSAFYGNLKTPLSLSDLQRVTDERYHVRYSFKKADRTCDGDAEVSTVERDGKHFIQGIRSLSGC